jgi:GT2 family glycosyltransferase
VTTALVLAHNCLSLTKRCVESLINQDVPVQVHLIDNGSEDGTFEWYAELFEADPERFKGTILSENRGVSWGWNHGLQAAFKDFEEYVAVVNNDTVLPPWFISSLLSYKRLFLTGVSVGTMAEIETKPEHSEPTPHPDFSAFLISAEAYRIVGPFDEQMVNYAGDCDWHIRAHHLGVLLAGCNLPFYHERSSTIRMAHPAEKRAIEIRADRDRAAFKAKYGFMPWDPEYAQAFSMKSFGCKHRDS